jgi:hypothetical protein
MSAQQSIQTTMKYESGTIDLEALADLLTESVIISKIDLGSVLVYKVRHALAGIMVLVNSCGDQNAVVYM